MQVDACFDATEALQPLPRLVYALLQSALLRAPASVEAAKLRALLCGLAPDDWGTVLYPALSSWTDPDTQVQLLASHTQALPMRCGVSRMAEVIQVCCASAVG